jgi:plastocyanin
MNKQIKMGIIAVVGLVIIGLIVWLFAQSSLKISPEGSSTERPSSDYNFEGLDEEAAEATNALINDAIALNGDQELTTIRVSDPNGEINEEGEIAFKEIQIVKVAPGTHGIDVGTGRVVDNQGQEILNDVKPSGPGAPSASFPLTEDQIPKSAIRLQVTSTSFSPNEFTVNRGQAVNLAVTNVNETTFSELLRFDDPSLKAVVVGVSKGDTISITFNAPTIAGEYTFYSDMLNSRGRGSVGKMIVK